MKKTLSVLAMAACVCIFASCDENSVKLLCSSHQHEGEDGVCVDDNVDHCGKLGVNCREQDGFENGRCDLGVCVAERCLLGYYLDHQFCKEEICDLGKHMDLDVNGCVKDDIDNCGQAGRACKKLMPGFLDGTCEETICIATSCEKNYKLQGGFCVAPGVVVCDWNQHAYRGKCENDDLNNCGDHGSKCEEQLPGFENGKCNEGVCVAESCKDGYELRDGICEEVVAFVECPVGAHLNHGICEPDDIDHCGDLQTTCKEDMPGFLDGKCENGSCIAESCLENYELQNGACLFVNTCPMGEHDNNGVCEADDIDNCGGLGVACHASDFPHSTEVECVSGQCSVKSCEQYYSLSSGKCSGPNCESGMHVSGATCKADDINNCGADGIVCRTSNFAHSASVKCSNGQCAVKSCKQYYSLSNGKCSGPNCSSGQHIYNGTCENNTVEHCGSHTKTCKTSDFPNSASVQCTKDHCVIGECKSGFISKNGECRIDCEAMNMFSCTAGCCRKANCSGSCISDI